MKNNQTTTEGNLKYHIETIVDSEWQKTDAQRVELLLELFQKEVAKDKKAVLEEVASKIKKMYVFQLKPVSAENAYNSAIDDILKLLAHSQEDREGK